MSHTPFLTIFPGCEDMKTAAGGLENAYVTDVVELVRMVEGDEERVESTH